jgi:hypothetical protein
MFHIRFVYEKFGNSYFRTARCWYKIKSIRSLPKEKQEVQFVVLIRHKRSRHMQLIRTTFPLPVVNEPDAQTWAVPPHCTGRYLRALVE